MKLIGEFFSCFVVGAAFGALLILATGYFRE